MSLMHLFLHFSVSLLEIIEKCLFSSSEQLVFTKRVLSFKLSMGLTGLETVFTDDRIYEQRVLGFLSLGY